ncbi:tRNA pseudouridine(55) synthase TruB [Gaiella sp.]|uniref:tRNA pseudouridine(55) synthase TruB n=1 Tax=Gaiella sp. TaxID=2663207 RepID=UPI0032634296
MAIPKALDPTGVILVDKPAGPSSFAVLAGVRSRTRAKTGHAGTLDPFATGLLLLLSGRATRLASCFVGLPKRYLTDVDLSCRTTTGDPEGDPLDAHEPPSLAELEASLAALRGDVELPIPTASAVKIGGERAYRLHRKGIAVEMPMRRSRVDALEVIAYTAGIATLDVAVSSGTYVRSIADALGGHCSALRRTEVGPFTVAEADAERVIPIEDALGRVGLTLAEADADRRSRADGDRSRAAAQAVLEASGSVAEPAGVLSVGEPLGHGQGQPQGQGQRQGPSQGNARPGEAH